MRWLAFPFHLSEAAFSKTLDSSKFFFSTPTFLILAPVWHVVGSTKQLIMPQTERRDLDTNAGVPALVGYVGSRFLPDEITVEINPVGCVIPVSYVFQAIVDDWETTVHVFEGDDVFIGLGALGVVDVPER